MIAFFGAVHLRPDVRGPAARICGILSGMRKILAALTALSAVAWIAVAASPDEAPAWTITLHPDDFVIGAALAQLRTRHAWPAGFEEQHGAFEIALRKKAVAIPAPSCNMEFLILKIPFYYPETPKQASVTERRAVYDAFVAFQAAGRGVLTARVEAPAPFARTGPRGVELAACNLLFAFPLSVQVSAR